MVVFDADPLLFQKKEPPPWAMAIIDTLSWWLPAGAGVLSIGAGLAALNRLDVPAALLGIGGGAASGFGVFFANWASRVWDQRLRLAYSVGSLGVSMADRAQGNPPSNF
jgi:hypothetical protein